MERLVTTSQAAVILGLSLQGIHYRIKKNQLKSIKKSGKIFVYINDEMEKDSLNNKVKIETVKNVKQNNETSQSIIDVKDEQILLLKDSMKWMKKQYKSEISRIEKNQKRIIKVFNSEIKLLQNAFTEMRTIYKDEPKELSESKSFISLREFFVIMKKFDKNDKQIKELIFKAIKNGDKRFIYNKNDKRLLILKSDFIDLV